MGFWESTWDALTYGVGDLIGDIAGDPEPSRLEGYQFPEFKEDPDYRATQDYLKDLGINILGGDIPDYYKGIGETGGTEFEKYLNLITGDIQRSALETSAALGRGGGRTEEIATQGVAEATTKSRYADYLRSLEGKQWLFKEGRGITEGVRGAGAVQGERENVFGLKRAGMDIDLQRYLEQYDLTQEGMQGEMIGNLLNLGLTAGGYALGGPAGAAVGSSIGSAVGGGGIDLDAIFGSLQQPKTTGSSALSKIETLGGITRKPFKLPEENDYLSYLN